MGTLRTPEMEAKYRKEIADGMFSQGCVLCGAASIEEFEHWRIINNKFPYDRVAKIHHMVIPKRHVPDSELTPIEREEFDVIKNKYVQDVYEYIVEVPDKGKSVPAHAHLHLIVAKS